VPTVPLFPLRTVLVPGLVLPLHIFEPRYRLMVRMIADAPEDERGFGIVAFRPGCSEADGRAGLYDIGTMARVTKVDELPDGRFDVITVGARRFSIDSLDDEMPFTRAEVTLHPEPVGEPGAAVSLAEEAVTLLKTYREVISTWGVIGMSEIDNLPDDPVVLSYLIAAAVVTDLPERQALLGIGDAEQRLEAVCEVLRREIEVMCALPSMPAVDLVGGKRWAN
jgi:Lon protease-like protein